MLGVVMAGGESRRLGQDKSALQIGAEFLWQRQRRVLAEAGAGRVIVMRRAGQPRLAGVECWLDQGEGMGPIAGLQAAFASNREPWIAVLAVDMPGIDAAWFRWLASFCRPGVGAMAQHPGALEPLAAIYPAEALAEVTERHRSKAGSLQRLARALAEQGRLQLIPVPAGQERNLRGINTPEDLAAWTEPPQVGESSARPGGDPVSRVSR